jgi:transposase
VGVIDAILTEDKTRPAKQRHTAKRIFERLKEEHDFTGGYTIVKDYVRGEQLRGREMFVPLVHPPGEAQADFGEALVVIAGVEQKAHFLAMDCPHSDDGFVAAFPGETTEAFQQGHVLAFQYFDAHSLRQHQDRGGADTGRRGTDEDEGIPGVAEPLSVRRQVWASRQGQR